jgi:uncharacterized protein (TIGR00725 family)
MDTHSGNDCAGVKRKPVAQDPLSGAPIRIGVMGSAGGEFEPDLLEVCRELGRAIARRGCCLLTGACPGLPQASVQGAKELNGHVIGISPAMNLKEHIETYDSPYADYDVLIYTGLGMMGRELINIRTSDIVVILGGRCGTLGEFAIAYEEGKLIGVLTGTGGIAAALSMLEPTLSKKTGAEILYEAAPERLIDRLLERYLSASYHCPCYPDTCPPDCNRACCQGATELSCG